MKTDALDFDIDFFENLVKQNPNYVQALIPLAQGYTEKGLYRKGLQIDKRLSVLCPKDPVIHYNCACSYALVGQKDEAFTMLRRAIQMGYRDFDHLKKDADLKSLHHDPRFETLMRSVSKAKKI